MSDNKKKYTRTQIGSVMKSKEEGAPPYIKIKNAVSLREGQTLKLESKKFKLQSLESAVAAGKLSGEVAEKRRSQIEATPDFVLFEIVLLESN